MMKPRPDRGGVEFSLSNIQEYISVGPGKRLKEPLGEMYKKL